jgi:hypothetical protein
MISSSYPTYRPIPTRDRACKFCADSAILRQPPTSQLETTVTNMTTSVYCSLFWLFPQNNRHLRAWAAPPTLQNKVAFLKAQLKANVKIAICPKSFCIILHGIILNGVKGLVEHFLALRWRGPTPCLPCRPRPQP